MTAQEFVQYMPASALAETVAHVIETIDPEVGISVVNICWRQLVALVGQDEAQHLVFGNNDELDADTAALLEVRP